MEEYMNKKLLGCLAIMLLIMIFPASASLVSFLVVETGLNDGVPITEYGFVWEDGLMSSFFDAGHIVTNSPITRLSEKPTINIIEAVQDDFNEARWGGADFFILGFLDFKVQDMAVVPVDITIRAFKTNTRELVFEHNYTVGAGRTQKEELIIAQNAGWAIASRIRDR
jgi:hypothetical protein